MRLPSSSGRAEQLNPDGSASSGAAVSAAASAKIETFVHSGVSASKAARLLPGTRKESSVLVKARDIANSGKSAAECGAASEIRVPACSVEVQVFGTMNRLAKALLDVERRKILQEVAMRPRHYRERAARSVTLS